MLTSVNGDVENKAGSWLGGEAGRLSSVMSWVYCSENLGEHCAQQGTRVLRSVSLYGDTAPETLLLGGRARGETTLEALPVLFIPSREKTVWIPGAPFPMDKLSHCRPQSPHKPDRKEGSRKTARDTRGVPALPRPDSPPRTERDPRRLHAQAPASPQPFSELCLKGGPELEWRVVSNTVLGEPASTLTGQ